MFKNPIDGKWQVLDREDSEGYSPLILLRYGKPMHWPVPNVVWDMAYHIHELEQQIEALTEHK